MEFGSASLGDTITNFGSNIFFKKMHRFGDKYKILEKKAK